MGGCYLCISSLFLLFPIIIFIYNSKHNVCESILALLLLTNVILE